MSPPESGVLLIVGPNNVGKSFALREVVSLLTNPRDVNNPPRVIDEVLATREGSEAEFEEWLAVHARRRDPGPGRPHRTYARQGIGTAPWPQLEAAWNASPPFGLIGALFVTYLGAGDSRGLLGSTNLWDLISNDPENPLQLMWDTPDLESALRDAATQAFGEAVFVNRYAGSQIHLQLGDPPEPVPPPPPRELVEQLRSRPHVHEQGDGIRSFLGILMTLIAGSQRILVVDEPEAFLHPPQAKLLGRKLAEAAPTGLQVIAATHSADVVVGALEATDTRVSIVRLTRVGTSNQVAELSHDKLRELWSDPFLRYSNVLDGLFHRGVVACEGDGDSLFFAAAFDYWLAARGLPPGEVLFTFSGGKAGLHKIASALGAVGVPVRLIADTDLLLDRNELARALTSLGHEGTRALELQRLIAADVQSRAMNPRKAYVADQLQDIFARCPDGAPLPAVEAENARRLFRMTGGADEFKRRGRSDLRGEARVWADELLNLTADAGLFVLPDGELESFDTTISGHGPEWVAKAVGAGVHTHSAVQDLIERVALSFELGR